MKTLIHRLSKKRQIQNLFFVIISCLLVIIGVLSYVLNKHAAKLKQLENTRHKLYSLSTELKESSENLTKYCRTYVLTGDSIWEQKFWEDLDIRNGKKTRPDGNLISLRDSLLKLGITTEEFEKLALAEKRSNQLVETEKVAFNAMKGIFVDKSKESSIKAKPDTLLARKVMYDKKYHEDKESITQPILEFRLLLDKRTSSAIENQNAEINLLLILIVVIILIISALSFYSIIILQRQISKHVSDLENSNKIIRGNEENLILQNQEISTLLENLNRKNAELLELNATKDKFFSIIAHDLKNPLSIILNFNELLLKGFDECSHKDIKQLAQLTYDSAKQTYNLLENLLAWARLQTGKITPVPVNIRLSALINEIINLYEPLVSNKNLKLETIIHSDCFIYADNEMVKTILRNLIINAIKYSYPNETIKLETQELENSILFTVSDSGIGIEPEFIDKLFNIENKLTKTGTEGELGTGLGLILCKEFVEMNNGEIWVESKFGKGSQFKFTMPLWRTSSDAFIVE